MLSSLGSLSERATSLGCLRRACGQDGGEGGGGPGEGVRAQGAGVEGHQEGAGTALTNTSKGGERVPPPTPSPHIVGRAMFRQTGPL